MTLTTQEIQNLLGHAASGLGNDSNELSLLSVNRVMQHGDFHRFSLAIEEARAGAKAADETVIRAALLQLAPWRKGPFRAGGVELDAEWNSTLKWDRLRALGLEFDGQTVLDVGAGNGFYARKLEEAGAKLVLAVEQSVLYAAQFMALQALAPLTRAAMLVLRAEDLRGSLPRLDTVLSMGVLYHVRSPIDHLTLLRKWLTPGARLVVETLVLAGDDLHSLTPSDRYANMRNVWFIPTLSTLETWLRRAGFRLQTLGEPVPTTRLEQRPTAFCEGPSLSDALDPADPKRTREGYPAPLRSIAIAEAV